MPTPHPSELVDAAAELHAGGLTDREVAARLGVPMSTVNTWRQRYGTAGRPPPGSRRNPCPRCHAVPLAAGAYCELLGWYFGDGHIGWSGRSTPQLMIYNDARYSRLNAGLEELFRDLRPGSPPFRRTRGNTVAVGSSWTHWPCLFPQHGPGRKHDREIELADWQRVLVEQHPGRFLRGLFHSDGCRITNWTTRTIGSGEARELKRYEYPRYFFTNHSTDILDLCAWALDLLGVAHRRPRPIHISVARREAVALLDQHVGPKS